MGSQATSPSVAAHVAECVGAELMTATTTDSAEPVGTRVHDVGPRYPVSAAIRKMIAGVTVLFIVCVLGVAGYVIAGWGLADGLYMVVISIFGVGYGEVRPVEDWQLRTLTGFVIIAGYGAVIYTVGGFIQLVVDGELNRAFGVRRMTKEIERLENHVIICGFGRMGQSLAQELEALNRPYVAIDTDPHAVERADGSIRLIIGGDATDDHVLERAGIHRASVLTTVLSDDATNVFVTLTARAMNPGLMIIARGENRGTEDKLRRCGADTVVMPTDIGATKISQLIVRPTAEEMLERIAASGDVDLVHLGLEFDELEVDGDSRWVGRSLGDIEVRGAHGYLIVGVRTAAGHTTMHPPTDLILSPGDTVIVLGYHDDIPQLSSRSPARRRTHRGTSDS